MNGFLLLLEGAFLCFVLLLICVVNIRNHPVGGVHFYEEEVKKRVIEMGLISRKEINRNKLLSAIPFLGSQILLTPFMVFKVNGADGFIDGFVQMLAVFWILALFDRLFIDWYWVGHTKAWVIPGTEDLRPYIPKKAWVKKWACTLFMYPIMAALLSWIVTSVMI